MRAVEMMMVHLVKVAAVMRRCLERIVLVLMVPVLAWQAPALAGGLPTGFGELPWEAPVNQLPDARKLAETALYSCYRSGDGNSTIGKTPVSNLRLCFAGDRFYFVQMEFAGHEAFDTLLAHGNATWGEGRAGQRFTETRIWGGGTEEKVYVELEYSREDGRGTLAFVYLPIYRETQEANRRQRARSAPGAGF